MMTNLLWYMGGLLTVPVLVMTFLAADRISAGMDGYQARRHERKAHHRG